MTTQTKLTLERIEMQQMYEEKISKLEAQSNECALHLKLMIEQNEELEGDVSYWKQQAGSVTNKLVEQRLENDKLKKALKEPGEANQKRLLMKEIDRLKTICNDLEDDTKELKEETDKLRVCLGSCSAVVLGSLKEIDKSAYGYSETLEDVMRMRQSLVTKESRIAALREALSFYANRDRQKHITTVEQDPEVGEFIHTDDFETTLGPDYCGAFSGRLARQALANDSQAAEGKE